MSSSARLAEFLDNLGISRYKFSKEIGVNDNALNKAIARGSDLKTDVINLTVQKYPNVNLHWLVTGEGEMFVKGAKDKDKTKEELLEKIQALEDRIKVLEYTLGTKDNIIANRGRLIEQYETEIAGLQFRIQQLEE